MKIIHCADIHLDSPLRRLSTEEKRNIRRAELILAFERMVAFAKAEGVKAIIIAGDLFDCSKVSGTAKAAVEAAIKGNPEIEFFYLRGNHDQGNVLGGQKDAAVNLHMFSDRWTAYDLGENICLAGAELNSGSAAELFENLSLPEDHFNIVTLHGQDFGNMANKNIDYLALGHIHKRRAGRLDERGIYCYPGCLEARGFDETGEHGFLLLDINGEERSCTPLFIRQPIREAHAVTVDISDCSTSPEIAAKISSELKAQAIPARDMAAAELVGETAFDIEKNPAYIRTCLQDSCFDFYLKDSSTLKVDYERFRLDESLKGEFIRTVEADPELSEEDKAEIIRTGIRALMGEEVE